MRPDVCAHQSLSVIDGSLRFSPRWGFQTGHPWACLKTLRHPASPASARGCSTLSCDARRSQTGRVNQKHDKSTAKAQNNIKSRSVALRPSSPLRHPRAGGDPVFVNSTHRRYVAREARSATRGLRARRFRASVPDEKEHHPPHACQQKTLARMARMEKRHHGNQRE